MTKTSDAVTILKKRFLTTPEKVAEYEEELARMRDPDWEYPDPDSRARIQADWEWMDEQEKVWRKAEEMDVIGMRIDDFFDAQYDRWPLAEIIWRRPKRERSEEE